MENAPRREMVKQLDNIVVPILRRTGFTGSFPHFRRLKMDKINLLTFQFDRSGGGFVIEIANCQPTGFTTPWGKKIEPIKLTAHDFYHRKRIQPGMTRDDSLTEEWFRYDKKYLFGFGNIYKKLCKDVFSKLDNAEDYWKCGELNG